MTDIHSSMKPVLRFIVGFASSVAVVFIVSWTLMHTAIPSAEAWSTSHCTTQSAQGCALANGFLKWWWATLLVTVVPATFLVTNVLMRRLGH